MKYEIVWKPRKGGKTLFRGTIEASNATEAASLLYGDNQVGEIISVTPRQTTIETVLIECVMSEAEKQAVAKGWR